MYNNKTIATIIAAAGIGSRMNADIPKQYIKIGGKPMLIKTAEIFAENEYIDEIIIVTNEEYKSECESLLQDYNIKAIVTSGGKERQDSVFEGLKRLSENTDYVLIHDAARPFVTQEIINETVRAVIEKKAVVCAVPVKDSIRMKKEDEKSMAMDRSVMYAVQTPQAFEKKLIIDAFEQAYAEGFYATDDATLAERAGNMIHIIEGSYDNIKITTQSDMPSSREMRVGTGFDVHAFEKGRKLVLGGVEIPFEKGLLGHSDADVLTHAVMDALLGATGLGDIGRHFPDNEQKYKDISSVLLLKEVSKLITSKGYTVGNIDVTVIAEKPKIAPHVQEMIKIMAETLNIDESQINIKGTTTEKLGFTGRGEGIAVQAICTVDRLFSPILEP